MAEELTFLSVPGDATGHAERFGAQYDVRIGAWFVVGPVPGELQNYIPREKNQRFHEVAPQCPVCGAPTRKLISRKGDMYWACIARFRTGCKGTVDYLKYLDDVAPVATVGGFLPKLAGSLFGPKELPENAPLDRPNPLKERWMQIALEALKTLGNDKQVLRWLEQPKVALGKKAPFQILGTEAGCDAVLTLLRDVWK